MYLEKLEVQGFKSFANKNVLTFPGMIDKTRRGITSVVGPNGSGKSNIADAVRWVLGEQSMKTLRGKKSEDVIFSGSDKKGKLGMAEVSLHLNNEDGKTPIDYAQLVLTRRLYRDGESEYLLNNSRVRLADVQILLAKAKFGQKTYSVIGQGMVEGFLSTSLAERKEFFDEATGVKQFQIKRDDSLNKLKASYENLSQAQILLDEIEPRLKSLTRQVGRLHKRGEIEAELKTLQRKYYSQVWHDLNNKYNEINSSFLELEKNKIRKEKEQEGVEKELETMEKQSGASQEFAAWQREMSELQRQKDDVTKKLAMLDAQLEVRLESKGQFDLAWLNNKKAELAQDVSLIDEELLGLQSFVDTEKTKLTELENKRQDVNKKIKEAESFFENQTEEKIDISSLNVRLQKLLHDLRDLETEEDAEKLKALVLAVREDLKQIVSEMDADDGRKVEEIQRELLSLSKEKEYLTTAIHEINLSMSTQAERRSLLAKQKQQVSAELDKINSKLSQVQESADEEVLYKEKAVLSKIKDDLDTKIAAIKEKISGFSREEEAKRSQLFSLQKRLHEIQTDLSSIVSRLNDMKISAARYETRLEDLENEIRESFGDFKEIRDTKLAERIETDEVKERINSLARQIDQIGGIDPEVEKEYIDTKERYDFLQGQVTDLLQAIKSLEGVVKELDGTIKERFDKEFKMISSKFEEYFKILFNGGHAKIIKVMENELDEMEPSEGAPVAEGAKPVDNNLKRIKFLQKHNATGLAGIEIQATPPGKKIKAISMLSGGERALVAIALICAIISVNPSPFVVLDEVDAALDEANSERLAKILDDLSHRTQFIVITHNRASMRRANILYGVTMQEDGVSKLLSVKLEDVKFD